MSYVVKWDEIPQGPSQNLRWIEEIVQNMKDGGYTSFKMSEEILKYHPMFTRGTLGIAIKGMIQTAVSSELTAT